MAEAILGNAEDRRDGGRQRIGVVIAGFAPAPRQPIQFPDEEACLKPQAGRRTLTL
jgi:hypothetical protein